MIYQLNRQKLVADWINPSNGDELIIKEGSLNPKTNIVEGGADFTPADDTLNTWNPISKYKLEGDIIKLHEARFRVTKENDKLYFKGLDSDTMYMRRSDFYKFEDIEAHQIGDTIFTDTVEFTLKDYGYADLVDPIALGGHAKLYKEEPFAPENGMTWARVAYSLFNKSNKTISLSAFDSNVRFSVVYQNNYTFGMTKHDSSSVIKGDGNSEHVQVCGGYSNDMSFPPLSHESFDTWFPVAPAVRDDTSAILYLLVLLPKNGGTELFVYEINNSRP